MHFSQNKGDTEHNSKIPRGAICESWERGNLEDCKPSVSEQDYIWGDHYSHSECYVVLVRP